MGRRGHGSGAVKLFWEQPEVARHVCLGRRHSGVYRSWYPAAGPGVADPQASGSADTATPRE